MRLLIISGFLGSGKTTLIIKLAEAASKEGLKVAILVNEIGEIGIDNQLMRQLDFNVWELLGGCICCTMAGDILETLGKLEKDHTPDLVITEPSGAADPQNLTTALDLYRGKKALNRYQVALLDPLRLDMLMEILTPLTTSTIMNADMVCINKADVATNDELTYAREVTKKIQPEAKLAIVSAKNGLEPDLIEEILSCVPSN